MSTAEAIHNESLNNDLKCTPDSAPPKRNAFHCTRRIATQQLARHKCTGLPSALPNHFILLKLLSQDSNAQLNSLEFLRANQFTMLPFVVLIWSYPLHKHEWLEQTHQSNTEFSWILYKYAERKNTSPIFPWALHGTAQHIKCFLNYRRRHDWIAAPHQFVHNCLWHCWISCCCLPPHRKFCCSAIPLQTPHIYRENGERSDLVIKNQNVWVGHNVLFIFAIASFGPDTFWAK